MPAYRKETTVVELPNVHDPILSLLGGTLHHVGVLVTIFAESVENILETIVNACRADAVRSVDPLDS
jgi:hypothetical protein